MPILTACFRTQQGGKGGQAEADQRRNMNEQKAFLKLPLPSVRAALFSATNKHEKTGHPPPGNPNCETMIRHIR